VRKSFWRAAVTSSSASASSSSSGLVVVGRRVEMGEEDESGMGRLERVERRRRVVLVVADGGRRSSSSSMRDEIGVKGGRARDRVGGRPLPAKLVMSTFILLGAMVALRGYAMLAMFGEMFEASGRPCWGGFGFPYFLNALSLVG
jgi:hypothetical protein